LIQRPSGNRPVTLLGWSQGARVIFYALEYLASLDKKDHRGIIQNVFLLGAPVTVNPQRWKVIRPLVAGRLVNGYSKADWLLPVIHRTTTAQIKPAAGNVPIDLYSVENVDLTDIVGGHLNYPSRLREILSFININSAVPEAFTYRLLPVAKEAQRYQCFQELSKQLEEKELVMKQSKKNKSAPDQPANDSGRKLVRASYALLPESNPDQYRSSSVLAIPTKPPTTGLYNFSEPALSSSGEDIPPSSPGGSSLYSF